MTADCVIRTRCRLCDGHIAPILTLNPTPLANGYSRDPSVPDPYYPLYLSECSACGHVQLPVEVRADLMFGEYQYVSGTTATMREHLGGLAGAITDRIGVGRRVLEIGSNDGTLLAALRDAGRHDVLGVDPAENLAQMACEAGLPTVPAYWSSSSARALATEPLDCIAAVNVFAHIPDIQDFTRGVALALKPGGWFVFEVGYLYDQLLKGTWDIVYHEHRDYHALRPLVTFLAKCGLHVVDAERVPTQGGSIRVWARTDAEELTLSWKDSVKLLMGDEHEFSVCYGVSQRVKNHQNVLRRFMNGAHRHGATLAYGAAAKLCTLAHGAEFVLDGVVDDNPLKQGMWTPQQPHGVRVPIMGQDRVDEWRKEQDRAGGTTLLLSAYNFTDEILRRIRQSPSKVLREARVLCPFPEPHWVGEKP